MLTREKSTPLNPPCLIRIYSRVIHTLKGRSLVSDSWIVCVGAVINGPPWNLRAPISWTVVSSSSSVCVCACVRACVCVCGAKCHFGCTTLVPSSSSSSSSSVCVCVCVCVCTRVCVVLKCHFGCCKYMLLVCPATPPNTGDSEFKMVPLNWTMGCNTGLPVETKMMTGLPY